MAVEKIETQWTNPCKYCLVKPACGQQCKLLTNHISMFEMWASLSAIIVTVATMFTMIVLSYFYWSKTRTIVTTSIYILVSYLLMAYHHIQNPADLGEMDSLEKWTTIFSFPWLAPSAVIWIFVEKYIDYSGYIFRFHKSINPSRKQ